MKGAHKMLKGCRKESIKNVPTKRYTCCVPMLPKQIEIHLLLLS